MERVTILFSTMLLTVSMTCAQVAINKDGSSPDASAMLDVKANDAGFLLPRMTTAERDAISNPAEGLFIYNLTTKIFNYYSNGTWKEIWSGNAASNASFTIGTGGSCANTSVNGHYNVGVQLATSNTVTLDVNVISTGAWSVMTNTVNGYSFHGSGIFNTTGTVQIILTGTGTPVAAQTDSFTATASGGGGTCTFDVTVTTWNCGDLLVDARDNQSYNTVQIGSQCWMAENLNIGTMIFDTSNQTDNGIIEKYCYNNNSANCGIYGGLYQWGEVMEYSDVESTQGICPTGWHVPSDTEWKVLETQLGMTMTEANMSGWRGTDEGSKMAGNGPLWTDGFLDSAPVFGSSGFTVLPAGCRPSNGAFTGLSVVAYLWSTSKNINAPTQAWDRSLSYNNRRVYRDTAPLPNSNSVRCVRD